MAQALTPTAVLSQPATALRLPLDPPKSQPLINPWFIAITVTLATFMELLDTAIANVALPHIAGGLAVSADESTWVLTSYLVSNAVVLPLSAWLSRLFGRKRYHIHSSISAVARLRGHTGFQHASYDWYPPYTIQTGIAALLPHD